MSSLYTGRPRKTLDDEMIPLINIVFLLLIFFMVAGYIDQQDAMAVQAPESRVAALRQDLGNTLQINAEGELAFGGNTLPLEQMVSAINQQQSPQATLFIKADKQLTAAQLAPVMRTLREAGFTQLRLLSLSPEDAG